MMSLSGQNQELDRTNQTITYLKEKNNNLSEELKSKNQLLTSYADCPNSLAHWSFQKGTQKKCNSLENDIKITILNS